MKKILFIGAHTDDVELNCGGTVAMLAEQHEVTILALSDCKESNKGKDLEKEFRKACKVLGVFGICGRFPVRQFAKHRNEIRETLHGLKIDEQPDVVFFHSANDTHQDHEVVHQECMRIFKDRCMVTYETPSNSTRSAYNLVIKLEQRHVNKKLEAAACYASQQHRAYFTPELIVARLRLAGGYNGNEYSETLKIEKWKEQILPAISGNSTHSITA